jgi:eukaryotic-like serine/threonine-protein kinase
MTPIVAILAVFGSPIFITFIVFYFRLRQRQLELGFRQEPQKLEALEKQRLMLEARVQNLESIVCSVDFELSQRLNRLAASASVAARALPPGPARPPAPVSAAVDNSGAPEPVSGLQDTIVGDTQAVYALAHLEVGRVVLGRYRIERELGRGGMGAVYLAHDEKLGERVALKVISSILASDPAQSVARFQREVQAARRVTHPNVVRIHDLGEDGPLLFLSMEFLDGETLEERLRGGASMHLSDALDILDQIAQGVAAAHAAGVIHRDLKPANVLLAAGTVKVIDFGLATTTFLAGMTATGMILGTAEYMAPEQVRGRPCDARTDVYALGAVAYHVLCGRPPFLGDTPIAIGFAHVNEAPTPPRQLRPDLPERLETVILRALEKDPAGRYADAGVWRRAFMGR